MTKYYYVNIEFFKHFVSSNELQQKFKDVPMDYVVLVMMIVSAKLKNTLGIQVKRPNDLALEVFPYALEQETFDTLVHGVESTREV